MCTVPCGVVLLGRRSRARYVGNAPPPQKGAFSLVPNCSGGGDRDAGSMELTYRAFSEGDFHVAVFVADPPGLQERG
jgi:hypothetical protein